MSARATQTRVEPGPLAVALVLLLVALPYVPGVFANGFVWLDHAEIVDGRLIATSWREALALFGGDANYPGYFRPVYDLVHSLDRALWGLDPRGFHLSSLALHLLNVLLVRGVLVRLGVEPRTALVVVALWGVHPVHTTAVGLVHAKADLAMTAALAGSVRVFLGGPATWARLAAAGSLVLVALYAKETAYVFVVGLAACVRPLARVHAGARRYLAVVAAATAVAAVHRALVVDAAAYASPLGLAERLATSMTVVVGYVGKLLWPAFPSVADTVTRFGALETGRAWMSVAAFASVVAAAAWAAWRVPRSRAWLVLFALALVPVLQIVPILHARADRFLYVPSLGFVGALLAVVAARVPRGADVAGARGGWLAAWSAVAILAAAHDLRTVRAFRDDVTLMRREVAREPRYREGWSVLARHAERAGDLETAQRLYAESLAPDDAVVSFVDGDAVLVNRASALLRLGRPEEVLSWVDPRLEHVSSERARVLAAHVRAIAAHRLGRDGEAYPVLAAFARDHAADATAQVLAARSALALGRADDARGFFARYLAAAPHAPDRAEVEAWLAEPR